MANYEPNWADPRIIRVVTRAVTFVEQYTNTSQKTWISSRELYKHFGNTSRPLGRYLKEKLLTVADPYYNPETGACKKYTKNNLEVQAVKELLGLSTSEFALSKEQEHQLQTGNFEYDDKSNRSYNSIQYIPKQYRGSILANHGYRYQYDIEAAAPTLLMQRAKRIQSDLSLHHLEYYTQNRSQVRQQIASQTNTSEDQIKGIINAILQGGALSTWHTSKTFEILNYDSAAMARVKADSEMQLIQSDIKSMWSMLKTIFPKKYETCVTGLVRTKRLSGRDKSGLYRELESEVSEVIRRLLKKQKIKHIWIHDGWCCNRIIDPTDVVTQVRRLTGYSVQIDYNIFKDI